MSSNQTGTRDGGPRSDTLAQTRWRRRRLHGRVQPERRLIVVQVDDRSHLLQVWLIGGPGPEALWPIALDGRYSTSRGEWFFPKSISTEAIAAAADANGNGNGN